MFIQKLHLKLSSAKMSAILSRDRWVKVDTTSFGIWDTGWYNLLVHNQCRSILWDVVRNLKNDVWYLKANMFVPAPLVAMPSTVTVVNTFVFPCKKIEIVTLTTHFVGKMRLSIQLAKNYTFEVFDFVTLVDVMWVMVIFHDVIKRMGFVVHFTNKYSVVILIWGPL